MCGICAVISKNTLSDVELETFKQVALLTTLRGHDSSGIIYSKNRNTKYIKSLVTLGDFVRRVEDLDPGKRESNPRYVIGHARAATIGGVTKENAHPHHYNHIVGVHNGTIHSFSTEAEDRNMTDSAILYERISEMGEKKAIESAGVNAAMALVWVDTKDSCIRFYRNSQRPLFMGRTHNDTLFLCSEGRMLEFIHARTGTSAISSIREVPEKKIFTVRMDGSVEEESFDPFRVIPKTLPWKASEEEEQKKGTVPMIPSSRAPSVPLSRAHRDGVEIVKMGQVLVTRFTNNKLDSMVNQPHIRGYRGILLPLTLAEKSILKEGCVNCAKLSNIIEEPVYFIDRGTHLCSDCILDDEWASFLGSTDVYESKTFFPTHNM